MDLHITHDPARRRFETTVDGHVAYLSYHAAGDGTLDYRRTFVPVPIRQREIGRSLVRHALAWAAAHGYEVVPSCPFVKHVRDLDG